jgi:DNA-binding IclR family transcriptional regulator
LSKKKSSGIRSLQGRVQSVEIGARLLRVIAKFNGPQMLKDIARAAGMTPGKAHRYLASFVREGLIEQNSADSRYDFGGVAREVGQAALGRLDVVRIGTTCLLQLHERLGETVLLGVWGNGGATVIYSLTAQRPVAISVRVGSILPTLTSAIGKVCAAYQPRTVTAESIVKECAANKKRGLPPKFYRADLIERMLNEVRENGYGLITGELMEGIHAIGVPVLRHDSKELVAVISCAGAAGSLDVSGSGKVLKELIAASQTFSKMLG